MNKRWLPANGLVGFLLCWPIQWHRHDNWSPLDALAERAKFGANLSLPRSCRTSRFSLRSANIRHKEAKPDRIRPIPLPGHSRHLASVCTNSVVQRHLAAVEGTACRIQVWCGWLHHVTKRCGMFVQLDSCNSFKYLNNPVIYLHKFVLFLTQNEDRVMWIFSFQFCNESVDWHVSRVVNVVLVCGRQM